MTSADLKIKKSIDSDHGIYRDPLHLRIRIREDSPLGAGALERAHLD